MKIQISPYGNFAKKIKTADGTVKTVTQVFDREAAEIVKAAFDAEGKEQLLDYEHERGKAAGWITALTLEDDGMYAAVRPTPSGAKAVADEEYLYTSADWNVRNSDSRPIYLYGAALTNEPNIGVQRIKNSKHFRASNEADTKNTTQTPNPKRMKSIALKLGLAEDADEAAILAAIDALAKTIADAESSRLENEAEAFVAANATRITNKDEMKAAYKANPEAVKKVFGNLAAQTVQQVRVTNSQTAKSAEEAGGVAKNAATDRVTNAKAKYDEWLAMTDGAESTRFYNSNKTLIDEGSRLAAAKQ